MAADLEKDIFTKLSGDVRITGLVQQKIYPGVAQRKVELPYITFERDDSNGVHHMTGASALVQELVEFNVYADSSPGRNAIAEALRDIFDGVFDTILGTTAIRSITLDDRSDFHTPDVEGAEEYVFRASMDFNFWYVRNVPANG